MKEFVLLFDIPREEHKVEVKAWRDLHRMGARMIQHSVWKSDKLQNLIDVAIFIKKSGGMARILEERFVF